MHPAVRTHCRIFTCGEHKSKACDVARHTQRSEWFDTIPPPKAPGTPMSTMLMRTMLGAHMQDGRASATIRAVRSRLTSCRRPEKLYAKAQGAET